jgi:hypothetical protein
MKLTLEAISTKNGDRKMTASLTSIPLNTPLNKASNFFAKVSLDKTGRYIYWEGEIEFCPDALRIKGTVIDEDYYLNKSMDEGKNTPLYSRTEAFDFLEK